MLTVYHSRSGSFAERRPVSAVEGRNDRVLLRAPRCVNDHASSIKSFKHRNDRLACDCHDAWSMILAALFCTSCSFLGGARQSAVEHSVAVVDPGQDQTTYKRLSQICITFLKITVYALQLAKWTSTKGTRDPEGACLLTYCTIGLR